MKQLLQSHTHSHSLFLPPINNALSARFIRCNKFDGGRASKDIATGYRKILRSVWLTLCLLFLSVNAYADYDKVAVSGLSSATIACNGTARLTVSLTRVIQGSWQYTTTYGGAFKINLPAGLNVVNPNASAASVFSFTSNYGQTYITLGGAFDANVYSGSMSFDVKGVQAGTWSINSGNFTDLGNWGGFNANSTVTVQACSPIFSMASSLSAPATATVNSQYNYTVNLNNTGGATVGTTTLKGTLPTGLSFVSGSSPGGFACSASAQVVTCNRTTAIAQNATDTLTLKVNPTLAGSYNFNMAVSGGGLTAAQTSNTVVTVVSNPPVVPVASAIYGGPGGTAFTDSFVANQKLTGITINSSSWIDSIQGITNNGALASHGGTGGSTQNVTWPANEYLVRVYGYYNPAGYIANISFVTNTGRTVWTWGSGSQAITYFDYTVPAGNAIVGFTGRSSTALDAIGVLYTPISATTPTVSLTLTAPVAAFVNNQYDYALDISNSFVATTGVTSIQGTLPNGLSFVSGSSAGGFACSATLQLVTCTRSTSIAKDSTDKLILTVKPTLAGNYNYALSISGGGIATAVASNTVAVNVVSTATGAPASAIYGGSGGTVFVDSVVANQLLTGINLKSGSWIDSIQGVTNIGTLASHGGTGGTLTAITWPANEYLVSINGEFNPAGYVGRIRFVTNTGRVFGPYGGTGQLGAYFNYTVPAGNAITGFTGKSSTALDAIGVLYAPVAGLFPTVSVALTAPANTAVNSQYNYTVNLSNTGVATTGVITVQGTLPTGVTFISGSSPGGFACTASAQIVTCTRSTALAQNGTDTLTLTVNPSIAGTYAYTMTLSGGNLTASTTSNSVSTVVTAAPNIATTLVAPASGIVNTQYNYSLNLNNTGGSTVGTLSLSGTLPAGVTFVSGSSAGGFACTASAQVVTCSQSGAMVQNATDTLNLTVNPAAAGSYTYAMTLSGGGLAANITSNSVTTVVSSASGLPVSSVIFGGPGGTNFVDTVTANQPLTGVTVSSGWWLDNIQGTTSAGTLALHGGGGGTPVNVSWPVGEYLVRIFGTYGNYVGQISFATNTGRILGPYGTGLGGQNAATFDYTVPAGNAIVGFTGLESNFLNAIGVQYAPLSGGAVTLSATLAAPATAVVNSQYNYSLSITNSGTATTGTLTIVGTLPAGLSFISGSSPGGFNCTAVAQLVSCSRSLAMPQNGTDSLTITVNPTLAGTNNVVMSVSGGGMLTTVTTNSIATVISAAGGGSSLIYGGTGGTAFTDTVSSQPLTGVLVSSAWWLDNIQGIAGASNLALHGGAGGTPVTVTWPAGEYLVRIFGTYGSYIGQISFVTNTGTILGPYGLGLDGQAAATFDYTVPTGNAIVGFIGRASNYLDAIGVQYSPVTGGTAPALAIGLSAPANSAYNSPYSYTATVTNTGGASVGTTTLQGTLPGGLSFVSGSSAGGFSCSASAQVVTCIRTSSIAQNGTDSLTLTVNPTVPGTYTYAMSLSGGGMGVTQVSNTVSTSVSVTGVDLAVSIAQPAPALFATALSEIPVTVRNAGTQIVNGSVTLKLPLPVGVDAPLKFARNADAWVCLNQASIINCTYNKPLAIAETTTVRLPVRPLASALGTAPGPFSATITAVTGETYTTNNTATMTPAAIVKTLAVPTITDPTYSAPLLDPAIIPKYALPLPNAFAAFFQHTPNTTAVPGVESYNLDIKQIQWHILPPGLPATDVYAYGDPLRPDTYSYPAHTIMAGSTTPGLALGKPVNIKFTDSRNPLLAHLLPVDHSIHGAMAQEPDIRSVAHLHGVKKADQYSDGYPEAWASPNGQTGSQFSMTTPTIGYNSNPFTHGNNQESTLLWYHDHTLGMTRLNVYAGLAGLYPLRDGIEQGMISSNQLPNGPYEIPLVLQDRMFHPDGSLAYPDLNPAVPTAPAPVTSVPEFFGDVMVVNGVAWPFLEVEPRRYRFRVLNGSSSRFYNLTLSNAASFQVIGTEGGFLAAPTTVSNLTIAPGERYDLVIDFSAANGQTILLKNDAAWPFPGGAAVTAQLHDQLMQFRVNQPLSAVPNNALPATLLPAGVPAATPTVATPRQVLLAESTDNNQRILPILGTVANGILGWMDTLTETPLAGTTETWEIFNDTVDAHPIHLHGGHFQIVNRQPFSATIGLNHSLVNIQLPSAPVLPGLQEKNWKDTVISYPGQVTRINVKFENAGLIVWHCHILEHEDHDMMRPMQVQ